MPIRFLAVGDVMADVVVSGRGHDADALLRPGGSAVNAALRAAAMGAEARILGRVGDDAAGRMIGAELRLGGVHGDLTVDQALPTGTFLVVDGEIRADRGANASFLAELLPPRLDAAAVLVSGHLPEETVEAALERSQATWTALSPANLARLPDGGDAIFVNADEARSLTGAAGADAVRQLGRRYRLACVTMGGDGAVAVLQEAVASVPAETARASGGGPGAGDAFAAAVLVALCAGAALPEALTEGARAGALAVGSGPE